nr:MAG TPA: hypothetical protein [Caudoviricetes sp.]
MRGERLSRAAGHGEYGGIRWVRPARLYTYVES